MAASSAPKVRLREVDDLVGAAADHGSPKSTPSPCAYPLALVRGDVRHGPRFVDITGRHGLIDIGQQFGCWTVLALHSKRHRSRKGTSLVRWRCRCACGVERTVLGNNLRSGRSTSCGQCQQKDFAGKRFGYWTVLAVHPKRYRRGRTVFRRWLCRCKCGTERVVLGVDLRQGKSTNCGCVRREKLKKRVKHGMSKTRIYWVWIAMRQRCFNPRNKGYPNYGGRGIGVEWQSFEEMYADVGDKPSPGLSIDRPDNDRSYGPSNYAWADAKTQRSNQRPYKRKKRRSKLADTARFADSLARAASSR
jgi:hypothetical protein